MSTPQVNNSDLNQALTPQINPDNKTFPPQQSNGSGFSEKCGAVCNDICKDKCNNICKDKCNDICKDKCNDICKDAMKISLIISIISLIFTIIAAICIGTVLSDRISELETNPDAYGILNVNETYSPGGYFGWFYSSNFPYLYPLSDLHVHVGDRIFFTAKTGTSEDLWLVPKIVYDSCNFTNKTHQIQLAISKWIRSDTYLKNESCIINTTCNNGWIMNEYSYLPGGYTFLIQDWHIREWGKILYFASAREWDNWKDYKNHGCLNGIRLRVFINERKTIPLIEDNGESFDLSALNTVYDLSISIAHLSRSLILQQFNFEQRVRSQGYSGLTNVRGSYDGNAAYDDGTYTNGAVASIHNHADNILIVGIGEISAVLNGVEFQTRHNDYNLNMASTTSSEYGATEAIPYPDVPPSVLNAGSVSNQIIEMQEYFRAFKTQNKLHRNYTKYFRPILCYLEGTWILDDNTLSEPFESDRHHIDASTWKQLHDQIRWMTNSGRKNIKENLAHLPSSIRNLVNNTYPIISNWEYRILCHPLKNDIPTSRFRIVDDLAVQLLGSPQTRNELYYSRRARFELNKYINLNDINNENNIEWENGRKDWNYLDYLMEQIPGKNNYISEKLIDNLPNGNGTAFHYINTNEIINAAYYSRYYKTFSNNIIGSISHRRGFNDRNLFAAMTTQSKVSPIELNTTNISSRWSYAIPFEIIYLTPLTQWNPYKILYYTKYEFDDSKTGECIKNEAYNGWTDKKAYFTPSSFFSAVSFASAGDTVADGICVIDKNGEMQSTFASGHWINFPDIGGDVGIVRQRYPIFPIHTAGTNTFKEIKSLQSIILPQNYDDPEIYPNGFFGDNRDLIYGFEVNLQGGGHQHVVYIQGWKVRNKWYDSENNIWLNSIKNIIIVEGEERNNHEHTLEIWRDKNNNNEWQYHIKRCRYGTISDEKKYNDDDWLDNACQDLHNIVKR